jgi:hypothetical protein
MMQKYAILVYVRYSPRIYVEVLRNTTKSLNQDNWSSGQVLNLRPLEYEPVGIPYRRLLSDSYCYTYPLITKNI